MTPRPLGVLCIVLGVLALMVGFLGGGPDRVGGMLFGAVALATGAVILTRPGGRK